MTKVYETTKAHKGIFVLGSPNLIPEQIGPSFQNSRQNDQIELIASENIVSQAVLEAAGSVLTNKYAEGYPGRRYYGGCDFVDVAEEIAIDRAKQLFGCDFANVQPHSGAQANAAVYFALLEPGDTILGFHSLQVDICSTALLQTCRVNGSMPSNMASARGRFDQLRVKSKV